MPWKRSERSQPLDAPLAPEVPAFRLDPIARTDLFTRERSQVRSPPRPSFERHALAGISEFWASRGADLCASRAGTQAQAERLTRPSRPSGKSRDRRLPERLEKR